MFPLTEEDDEPSNQTTPNGDAKSFSHTNEDDFMTDASELADQNDAAIEDEPDSDVENESMGDAHLESMTPAGSPPSTTTPQGSPPEGLFNAILDGTYTPSLAAETNSKSIPKPTGRTKVSKIALLTNSASQTPRESASTPAESTSVKLLDPEDDVLSDSELPGPWIPDAYQPPLNECEDLADYLLHRKYETMTDVNQLIAGLNKYPANQRSTANLYALVENAQYILKQWQDEYLELDARVSYIVL
jgi:hypothetical protein